MWPIADAFKNNFSATPQTILQGLNNRKTKRFSVSFTNPVKNIWNMVFGAEHVMGAKTANA